jgi:hypothetical protein
MSFWIPTTYDTSVNLQSTVAAATADNSLAGEFSGPHHPITCSGQICVDEDNTIRCEHSKSPPKHPRNQACFDCSIAILIMEIACNTL